MKHYVLGTAGHIDHGKTTLIKALTGIDCDRLPEEKKRGITIDLGFAWMKLSNGSILGIVDVPGHEKFIKNMVAGATGMDLVMLIIAADEGVMPQTREHLDICKLLNLRNGLVALTKVDIVEPEWLEMVEEDIREFLAGSFLEAAPIVPVSAIDGRGIDHLRGAIETVVQGMEPCNREGAFRMPIDRVFVMRGFGTVVTGTTISGQVKVGDEVQIYPGEHGARVRGLEVHNLSMESVEGGFRTAVNLQGVDRSQINRGDVLAHPGTLRPTRLLDADLTYLSDAPWPLKNRAVVRFHAGTSEIMARVTLLDKEIMEAGQSGLVQLSLEKHVSLLPRDRFVIRSYSPVFTVGGGAILDVRPRRHRKGQDRLLKDLAVLQTGNQEEMVAFFIREAAYAGISLDELSAVNPLSRDRLKEILERLGSQDRVRIFERESYRMIDGDLYEGLLKAVPEELGRFHRENPLKPGITREGLRALLPSPVEQRLFNAVLDDLSARGLIVSDREILRMTTHSITLGKDQQRDRQLIEEIFQQAGLEPPLFKELVDRLGRSAEETRNIIELLVAEGVLVKVKDELYFYRPAVEELEARLTAFLREHGEISTGQFKELTRVSRKFMIPLGEYFDGKKLTLRLGDKRVLRS
jgi:selenocysteine-specific elongation factor